MQDSLGKGLQWLEVNAQGCCAVSQSLICRGLLLLLLADPSVICAILERLIMTVPGKNIILSTMEEWRVFHKAPSCVYVCHKDS